ncbi:hypothetical protein BofuT4_uP020520.1 [Botrytis cinerea T4]|uniref:Uncharacterized protein n=1 Tax=Botryotinia fuckeliana (strain T4) TaxID=999810 RepID=G2YJ59_BOTF4|nr:hypothetical protein BofuT4_uP020520.1 [Botrytis cinerea T4]
MHQTGGLRNEEANAAAWEAGKGAAVGGAKIHPDGLYGHGGFA